MNRKRFLKLIFFLFAICIVFFSAILAYFKTKDDIIKSISRFFGKEVSTQEFSFSILSGIKIKELKINGTGTFYNIRINYDIFELAIFRTFRKIYADSIFINGDTLLNIIQRKEKKEKGILKGQESIFFLPNFNTRYLKIKFGKKLFLFENIKGNATVKRNAWNLRMQGEMLSPENIIFSFVLSQKSGTYKVNLTRLKHKDLEVSGKASYIRGRINFSLFNTRYKNFYLSNINGELKKESEKEISIKTLEGKGENVGFSLKGRLVNFLQGLKEIYYEGDLGFFIKLPEKDENINIYFKGKIGDLSEGLKKIYYDGSSSFSFKKFYRGKEIIANGFLRIQGKGENFSSYVNFDNINISELKNGTGFISLLKDKKGITVDSLYIKFKEIEGTLKGSSLREGNGSADFQIHNLEKIVHFAGIKENIKGKGRLIAMYEWTNDSLALVARFTSPLIIYKDFRLSDIQLSLGYKPASQTLRLKINSIYNKETYLGEIELGLNKVQNLITYELDAVPYVLGPVISRGKIVYNDSIIELQDKDGHILFVKRGELYQINFKNISLMGGKGDIFALIDFEKKEVQFHSALKNFDLTAVPYLSRKKIEGVGEISLHGKGSFDNIVIEGEIKSESFYHPILGKGLIHSQISLFKDTLRAFAVYEDRENKEENMKLQLSIPLYIELYPFVFVPDTRAIEAEFAVNKLPISILKRFYPDYLNIENGKADAHFEILTSQNKFTGEFVLAELTGSFLPTGTPFENIHAFITIENENLTGNFKGYSGRGKIIGEGFGSFSKNYKIEDFYLEVKLKKSPLFFNGIESLASGEIEYYFSQNTSYITGKLTIDEAFILPLLEKESASLSYPKFMYEIVLRGDRKIFITSEWIDAELNVDIKVQKEDPLYTVYSGEMNIVRGKIFYLGHIFNIEKGSFNFLGIKEFNPLINITGKTDYTYRKEDGEVENLKIFLEVGGNLKKPTFHLSSEPVAYTTNELLQILSVGGTGTPVFSHLGYQGFSFTEQWITAKLKERIKIQEIALTTGARGTAPTFTLGSYIGEDIYIKYRHNFLNLYKDSFLLKYFLNKNFSIYSQRESKGEYFLGLEWEYRF